MVTGFQVCLSTSYTSQSCCWHLLRYIKRKWGGPIPWLFPDFQLGQEDLPISTTKKPSTRSNFMKSIKLRTFQHPTYIHTVHAQADSYFSVLIFYQPTETILARNMISTKELLYRHYNQLQYKVEFFCIVYVTSL